MERTLISVLRPDSEVGCDLVSKVSLPEFYGEGMFWWKHRLHKKNPKQTGKKAGLLFISPLSQGRGKLFFWKLFSSLNWSVGTHSPRGFLFFIFYSVFVSSIQTSLYSPCVRVFFAQSGKVEVRLQVTAELLNPTAAGVSWTGAGAVGNSQQKQPHVVLSHAAPCCAALRFHPLDFSWLLSRGLGCKVFRLRWNSFSINLFLENPLKVFEGSCYLKACVNGDIWRRMRSSGWNRPDI